MRILALEPIHPDAEQVLAAAGEVVFATSLEAGYIQEAVVGADALIVRAMAQVTRPILEAGRNLRCVARCGVGTDNIDVAAATERGLPVIYAPGSNADAVAEHTMLLMLAVLRRLVRFDHEVKAGNWMYRREAGLTQDLKDKTLGIVGLGAIGRRVAELGQAFGMQVSYWSRQQRDARFQYRELRDLAREADVLSLHVELNPETHGLVDRAMLESMKPTSILINTARGEVLDEQTLGEVLKAGKLAGAGLDVIDTASPLAANPLWQLDSLIVTPHVAALTEAAFRELCLVPAQQVARILRGDKPDPKCVKNPGVLKGIGDGVRG